MIVKHPAQRLSLSKGTFQEFKRVNLSVEV